MFMLIILTSLIPLCGGIFFLIKRNASKKINTIINISSLSLVFILSLIVALINKETYTFELFKISDNLRIVMGVDQTSKFFSLLFSFILLIVSIYSIKYFEEEHAHRYRFDAFYLLSLSTLMALSYTQNLISMYLSFELVSLLSMPLVLFDLKKESINASFKYLFYSVGGAFLGLISVIYLSIYTNGEFIFNGSLNIAALPNQNIFYLFLFCGLIGFGAKAGMYPLHSWLASAHPVAPSPASAILSGIITKSGVLAILRLVYYVIGPDNIVSSWVQYAWIILIVITILLGSFMACLQKNFKKRLAYSSVSQLSYVLLGIALLNQDGLNGSYLHIFSHAFIKVSLFLVAGVLLVKFNKKNVDEVDGLGKYMPITFVTYTIASLGLIGVPPTGGFVSKFNLCIGALNTNLGVLRFIIPVSLIISAILTAYYLLEISLKAFFKEDKSLSSMKIKEDKLMYIPLIILSIGIVLGGIFASNILTFIGG